MNLFKTLYEFITGGHHINDNIGVQKSMSDREHKRRKKRRKMARLSRRANRGK